MPSVSMCVVCIQPKACQLTLQHDPYGRVSGHIQYIHLLNQYMHTAIQHSSSQATRLKSTDTCSRLQGNHQALLKSRARCIAVSLQLSVAYTQINQATSSTTAHVSTHIMMLRIHECSGSAPNFPCIHITILRIQRTFFAAVT
jgi:hypothetical protein